MNRSKTYVKQMYTVLTVIKRKENGNLQFARRHINDAVSVFLLIHHLAAEQYTSPGRLVSFKFHVHTSVLPVPHGPPEAAVAGLGRAEPECPGGSAPTGLGREEKEKNAEKAEKEVLGSTLDPEET